MPGSRAWPARWPGRCRQALASTLRRYLAWSLLYDLPSGPAQGLAAGTARTHGARRAGVRWPAGSCAALAAAPRESAWWLAARSRRSGRAGVRAALRVAVGVPRPQARDVPADRAAHRALGLLGQPRHPLHRLVLGRLGQARRLGLRGPRSLLHRGAVRGLAGQLLHLLVTLPARPRADDESDGEAGEEREPVPHLATSSQRCRLRQG